MSGRQSVTSQFKYWAAPISYQASSGIKPLTSRSKGGRINYKVTETIYNDLKYINVDSGS